MNEEDKKLIADYFANRISDENAPKLRQLLNSSIEARKFFRTFSALSEHVEELKNSQIPSSDQPIKYSQWTKHKATMLMGLAALLVLGLMTLLIRFPSHSNPESKIADVEFPDTPANSTTMVQSIELIDHFDVSLKDFPGGIEHLIWNTKRYQLLNGQLHLRFNQCVDLIFEGPGIFEIRDFADVLITDGIARIVVLDERGKGFKVQSPTTSYIDWGTEFSLMIRPNEKDKFIIDQGEVEIFQNSNPSDSSFVTRSNREIEKVKYIKYDKNLNSPKPGEPGAKRYKQAFEDLKQNPHVIGLYDFNLKKEPLTQEDLSRIPTKWSNWHRMDENEIAPYRLVENHSISEIATHGIYHMCHRAKGRWPGSFSLSLPHATSFISLSIPQELPEFTANFWLKKFQQLGAINKLIRPDRWEGFGNFAVDFSRNGQPNLSHWGESFINSSRPSIDKLSTNWQLVTCTFGKERNNYKSKIYINGKLVLEATPTWTKKVKLNHFTIGGLPKDRGSYNLNCYIDEIVMLDKSWDETEINHFFRDGFPYYTVEPNHLAQN